MKQILFKTFALVCMVCGLVSCSEDKEPKKITLPKDQPTSLTFYADDTSGTVSFNAAGSWSAFTSTQSRASEEIDWLTIFDTHGNAGDNTISYSMEPNDTESSRTAYIIILCEDEQLSVKITQSNEEDPDDDDDAMVDPFGQYRKNMNDIFHESLLIDYDGNLFSYNRAALVEIIKGNPLTWNISLGHFEIVIQTVHTSDTQTAGPSYNIGVNENGFAKYIEIVHPDGNITSYRMEYNVNYLTKCIQYDNWEESEKWEIKWDNGDIVSVKSSCNQGTTLMTPVYSDVENMAGMMEYDTMFGVDLNDCAMFYYCGLFGYPTRHLLKSTTAIEQEGAQTYNFTAKYDYSFDSKKRPVKVVYSETEDGESYSSQINYTWKDR